MTEDKENWPHVVRHRQEQTLLAARFVKAVNGIILTAVYMTSQDVTGGILSLFYRDYTGYHFIQFITQQMWDDDGMLVYITAAKI